MYYPSKKEYLARAKTYNLIPVYKEYMVDTETPVSIFIRARGIENEMFLLESIEGIKKLSRYSFIGMGHSALVRFENNIFSVEESEGKITRVKTAHPLTELEKFMRNYIFYKDSKLNHFTGGAVGYLSYDLVKYFENIPIPEKGLLFPEIMLKITDTIIVFDHLLNTMKIISTVKINKNLNPEKAYFLSVEKIERLEKSIFNSKNNRNSFNFFSNSNSENNDYYFNSNFTRESYIEAVKRAKKYINEGEAFQIVLSQRFSTSGFNEPFNIYRALRTTNPSPYMYYIDFGKFKIIGSSPEPLIKITGKKILTYPIAGTRRRGKSDTEDRMLVSSLLNDEKERAEHNMLVDLARNDLGRICRYGSVKVKKYMSVEKYSHVIHLVSRVEGTLDSNKTIYDAIKSVFPAGTLSGAPKIRAMQIISELEPDKRGPYGGVVGYFGYDGNLDSCITIRTALIKEGKAYIQAGAGIVYDSVPENEWQETINKASALFKSIKKSVNDLV